MATNNTWNSQNPAQVAVGGLGVNTLPAHAILVGEGTSAVSSTGTGSAGQILISKGSGSDPGFITPTAGTGLTLTSNATTLQYAATIPVPVPAGGTAGGSWTPYAVMVGGATTTGVLQQVSGLGTSGQILTSSGSGVPSWQYSPGGALVLISTQTASSSTDIQFTSGISTTYSNYLLTVSGGEPVTTSQAFRMQLSTNGGASYLSTGYLSSAISFAYNSTTSSVDNQTTYISLGSTISSTRYFGMSLWLMNLSGASGATTWTGSYGGIQTNLSMGYLTGSRVAASYNAIKLYHNSGNINKGTFSLYGITK